MALVVAPGAQGGCVGISEADVAGADSDHNGVRDRKVRPAYRDTLAIVCSG